MAPCAPVRMPRRAHGDDSIHPRRSRSPTTLFRTSRRPRRSPWARSRSRIHHAGRRHRGADAGRSSSASTRRWARRSARSWAEQGVPAGPHDLRGVRAGWSTRTADEDPGAPFMNESPKYVVSSTLRRAELEQLDGPRRLQRRGDPLAQGARRRRHLRQRQRHPRARDARRRPRRRAAPVRLPGRARLGAAAVRRRRHDEVRARRPESYDNGVVHLTYTAA